MDMLINMIMINLLRSTLRRTSSRYQLYSRQLEKLFIHQLIAMLRIWRHFMVILCLQLCQKERSSTNSPLS